MGNYIVKPPPSIDSTPLLSHPTSVETENDNLRVFNLGELKKATNKFRQDKVVSSEYGCVRTFYKGYIDKTTLAPSNMGNGIAVSVMESCEDISEWKEEVISLAQISHPNLVKIFGYCCCEDNNKCFLVYEYSHKGTLDRHIFENEEALPWGTRIKIAIGAAQGLAFLHSVKNESLNRQFKMSTFWLDEQYNAKMLYLGSNKLLVDKRVFIGKYIPPEYALTGHLCTKSDVYTFGVILLELLIGLKANRKKGARCWTYFLSDANQILKIIDPRLVNDYPVNAAVKMAKLIKRCIEFKPETRPSMQQVLDGLNEIAEIKD